MNLLYDSKDVIEQCQIQLLKKTLNYVYKYSCFYKRMFDTNHIKISEINTLSDIEKLPITTKHDLLTYNNDFYCGEIKEASDIVTTSGSTGIKPIIHPLTQRDLSRLMLNETLSFEIAGIDNNDAVMLCTALDGSFVAGLAYYYGLKNTAGAVFRVGAKSLHAQAEILYRYNISTIVGVPSNLIKLFKYMESNHLYGADKVRKMVLIGESIRNKNLSLNQLGSRLASCYPNAELHSTYANTETCTSFCECNIGNGGHLLPNLAYIEIVDEVGNRVEEGHVGRLLITTFDAQGMPLLRYDTGDLTYLINEPCKCGIKAQRIGPILDRNKSISKIGGVTFSQSQLENVILSIPQIDDYCIVIDKDDNETAQAKVFYLTLLENSKHVGMILKQKIWDCVRISVEVECCTQVQLHEKQHITNSRKPVRYINNNGI